MDTIKIHKRKQDRDELGRFIPTDSLRNYEVIGDKLTYNSWLSVNARVRQGERYYEDVSVCPEWTGRGGGYERFVADMGLRPSENHTLNRKIGAKLYSKENCEWADKSLQKFDTKRNVRNTSGVTGVSFLDRNNYWVAQYRQGKMARTLISSKDFLRAVEARIIAEVEYRGFSRILMDWKNSGVPEQVFRNGLTEDEVKMLIEKYGDISDA